MKVLATGATGQYAGHVVPALVRRGITVRGLVHDPDKADTARTAGVSEVALGDLGDTDAVQRALDGVDGVFLITPAFHPQATEMALGVVESAVRAGVRRIVYNGVYHPSLALPNHESTRAVEAAVYGSGLEFTVLQPAMYLQGLDALVADAARTGELVQPWSKTSQMAWVDYRDVAEVVAIAFAADVALNGTFELAAGGTVSREELADLVSAGLGRPVQAVDLPADADVEGPPGIATMFAEYDRVGFRGGNPLALQTLLGRPPLSVAEYVAQLTRTRA